MQTDQILFDSVHNALKFAYNYTGQSPKTPLMSLIKSDGTMRKISKGLTGVDGAAQSGMILAEVDRLTDDQKAVVMAGYGNVKHNCKCCGNPTSNDEWKFAIFFLTKHVSLRGSQRDLNLTLVENAICKGSLQAEKLSKIYGHSSSTLYRERNQLRETLRKIERAAINELEVIFRDKGLI